MSKVQGKVKLGDNGVINRVVAIDGLRPHPRNYNKHDEGQIEDLRLSLRTFGQVRSIVAQATKHAEKFLIVAGHGLVQAATLEGFTRLKCDVIPASWKPARVLAYLAADNELARRGLPDEAQLAALVEGWRRRRTRNWRRWRPGRTSGCRSCWRDQNHLSKLKLISL